MTTDTLGSELGGMQPAWKSRVISPGGMHFRPRQFEYHPHREGVMVFGTLRGDVVVTNHETSAVVQHFRAGLSENRQDSILGLCWLRQDPDRFVSGSANGVLRCCDISETLGRASALREERREMAEPDGAPAGAGGEKSIVPEGLATRSLPFQYEGSDFEPSSWKRDELGPLPTRGVVQHYARFRKLTSVHIDAKDSHLLASGYDDSVRLYDLGTGQVVHHFSGIHDDHINIRYACRGAWCSIYACTHP